jgi:hypothetical protein
VVHVTIGGHAYTIWLWKGRRARGQISYVMDRVTLSVHDLDLGAIVADAARRPAPGHDDPRQAGPPASLRSAPLPAGETAPRDSLHHGDNYS